MHTHDQQRAAGFIPAELRPGTRLLCSRTGTAAMELAFILPVLIAFVLLSVDLGRGTHYDLVLSNAAREGAAWGATHRATDYTQDDWEEQVELRVQEEAASLPDFDSDELDVDIEIVAQLDGSNRIEVEVVYPFEMMLDWPGYPQTIALRRRVAMQEYR